MKRAILVVVTVLACCPMRSFAQNTPITLTEKITSLDGLWIRDRAKGVTSSCPSTSTTNPSTNTIEQTVRISVSPQGISIESARRKWIVPLDGSPSSMMDSGSRSPVATATLDAGWLALTARRTAPLDRGTTNVFREVYVASNDELTIWRNFTVEWPDGSLSSTVCSYREALVYRRQKQP